MDCVLCLTALWSYVTLPSLQLFFSLWALTSFMLTHDFLQSPVHSSHHQNAFSNNLQPDCYAAFLRSWSISYKKHVFVTFHKKQVAPYLRLRSLYTYTLHKPFVNKRLHLSVKAQVLLWKLNNLVCIFDQIEIIAPPKKCPLIG